MSEQWQKALRRQDCIRALKRCGGRGHDVKGRICQPKLQPISDDTWISDDTGWKWVRKYRKEYGRENHTYFIHTCLYR